MEEYEPLISDSVTVFAGVDYAEILSNAEKEADIIIWDGGNNDPAVHKAGPRDSRSRPLKARA